MAHRLAALTAVVLCIGWSAAARADHIKDGPSMHRMVFQIDEDHPKLWNLMLNDVHPGIVRIIELQEKGYGYLRP
jgi:hypothetical protein